jgi:crotonobetainyl-CoA:carnitine CoA-transferase CaiB-like acyl-CoA transferase
MDTIRDSASISAMPVLGFKDLPQDAHVMATDMFTVVEHPSEGAYKHIRAPVRSGATPSVLRRHAPRAGADNEEVLAALELPQLTNGRLMKGSPHARAPRGELLPDPI